MNSKRSVQHAMIVSTNGMVAVTRLRKNPVIRGKDKRGRMPLWI
jgi:hypothetical protein